jgi:hypothetical protein
MLKCTEMLVHTVAYIVLYPNIIVCYMYKVNRMLKWTEMLVHTYYDIHASI